MVPKSCVAWFDELLDCTDGLVGSLKPAVGVAVSDWALFVDDFGWDVRAVFVF